MKDAVAIAVETGLLKVIGRNSGFRWYRCEACREAALVSGEELRRWGAEHFHGCMMIEDEKPYRQ